MGFQRVFLDRPQNCSGKHRSANIPGRISILLDSRDIKHLEEVRPYSFGNKIVLG